MNLTHLSEENLRSSTLSSVAQERASLNNVLHHIKEVDRRRLYSKWQFKSLFDYVEKELKYPGDQAYRRITAMKLLKELPEIEKSIVNGELSLTHLNEAKKVFNKKPYSKEEKLKLCQSLSNTTKIETLKIISRIIPEPSTPDKIRILSSDRIEFKFTGTHELDKKLKLLKGKYAHSNPGISLGELIEKLADHALREKILKSTQPSSKAELLRQIRKRDQNKCTNCESTYALEIDHIIPISLGGLDTFENLRLLCRHCNQRSAIQHLGQLKMDSYINKN